MLFFTTLLLFTHFLDTRCAYISETSCPQVCQCLDKDVGCNNLNLSSLPSEIDPLTEKLELAENKLSAESLSLKLRFYPNLKTLDLRDNFITVINQDLFFGLQNTLESLDLSGNGIRSVERNTLSTLTNLKYLKMSRNDLVAVPELPENLEMLDLSENFKINALKYNSLRKLKKLRHLILNDCSIYTIDDDTFADQSDLLDLQLNGNSLYQIPSVLPSSLTSISLQDNRIRSVGAPEDPVNPFKNLTRLERLLLQRNWISKIGDDVLSSLKSLRELHLTVNRLTAIPSSLPSSLMVLDIGGNQLTQLTPDSGYNSNNFFEHLPNLERLGLSNNTLQYLPAKLLQENHWLSVLDLSDNEFSQIPNFYSTARLELNLDGNRIREIDESSFKNCPNIKKLYLNNNQITRIIGPTITSVRELKTLELRGNVLRDLPIFVSEKLANVDLSFNYIQSISPWTFNDSKSLVKINLENNELTKLDESVFENLPNLRYLILANNKIIEMDFFVPDSVRELQIHHNQLATIGNLSKTFFSSSSYLTALDLSANNILSVAPFAFANFRYLTDLYLDENRLSALNFKLPFSAKRITVANNTLKKLESGSLSGLAHAYFLDLTGNKISLIEKDFFVFEEFERRRIAKNTRPFEILLDANYIQTMSRSVLAPIVDNEIRLVLSLAENPIRCNCLWTWLSKELSSPYLEVTGSCHFPAHLRNRQIASVPNDKLECFKPKIETESKNMKLITSVGSTAMLSCKAEGEPIPFYTWAIHSSNGNDLITLINDEVYDDHFYVLLNGSLVIHNVKPSDSELIYACIANNYVGYDVLSIKLVLQEDADRGSVYEVWETSTQFPPSITPRINLIGNESTTQNYDKISFELSQGTTHKYPWTPEDSTKGSEEHSTPNNGYKPNPWEKDETSEKGMANEPESEFSVSSKPETNGIDETNKEGDDFFHAGHHDSNDRLSVDSLTTIIAVACGLLAIIVVMILIITIYALLKRKQSSYMHRQAVLQVPVNGHHKGGINEDTRSFNIAESGRPLIEHHDTSEYMFITSRNSNDGQFMHLGNDVSSEFFSGCQENPSSHSNNDTPTESVPGSIGYPTGAPQSLNNNSRSYSGSIYHSNKLKLISQMTTESNDSGVCPNSKRSQSDDAFQPYPKQLPVDQTVCEFSYVSEKPELIEFCDRESMV